MQVTVNSFMAQLYFGVYFCLSSMLKSRSLMTMLGMKIMVRLIMSPRMQGIASVAVNYAQSLQEMKRVTMKLPERVIIPVYLRMEIAVSARSFDNMQGTEYLFLKRYCSERQKQIRPSTETGITIGTKVPQKQASQMVLMMKAYFMGNYILGFQNIQFPFFWLQWRQPLTKSHLLMPVGNSARVKMMLRVVGRKALMAMKRNISYDQSPLISKLSIESARILAKVLKMPALKNQKRLTLTSSEEFMWVTVQSPSLSVMKTRNSERMALKIERESEEMTLKRLIRKVSVMLFFCTYSQY